MEGTGQLLAFRHSHLSQCYQIIPCTHDNDWHIVANLEATHPRHVANHTIKSSARNNGEDNYKAIVLRHPSVSFELLTLARSVLDLNNTILAIYDHLHAVHILYCRIKLVFKHVKAKASGQGALA